MGVDFRLSPDFREAADYYVLPVQAASCLTIRNFNNSIAFIQEIPILIISVVAILGVNGPLCITVQAATAFLAGSDILQGISIVDPFLVVTLIASLLIEVDFPGLIVQAPP